MNRASEVKRARWSERSEAERSGAKRSEAKRARKRALSHVVVDEFHLQNLKIAITRKLSILEIWCQKNHPARPLSRFWEAYYSETINFREKNYRTKNVYPNDKFFVLKFGNDPMSYVLGRPYFVRVTFFTFFGYISWSNKNFQILKTAFERTPENLSDCMYIFAIFLFKYLKNWNFMKKWRFSPILFNIFAYNFNSISDT